MSIGQIIAYLVALGLLALAFWLAKKKQPVCCTIVSALTVGVLFAAMFAEKEIFIFKSTLSGEQWLCWIFGAAFLRLAYDFIKQKDSGVYAFLIFIVAAFTCFCGLSGVQAILKTHMLNRVTESLNSYGEALDEFQTNVFAMKEDVAKQRKQISEVEYWVKNLYQNMTNEIVYASNTNQCRLLSNTNGSETYLIRLSKVPIENSVQVSAHIKEGMLDIPPQRIGDKHTSQNIILLTLQGGSPYTLWFLVDYVIDNRQTNYYKNMPVGSDLILTNGDFLIRQLP